MGYAGQVPGKHIQAERMNGFKPAGINVCPVIFGYNFFLENIQEFKCRTAVKVSDKVNE